MSTNGKFYSSSQKMTYDHRNVDSRSFIEHLKLQRLLALGATRRSLITRARRKLSDLLSRGVSLGAIFLYFIDRSVVTLKRRLAHYTPRIGQTAAQGRHLFTDPVFVALRLTGGVGDAVMVARLLRALSLEAEGDDYVIDLFYSKPDNIRFLFEKQCRARAVIEDPLFDRIRRRYDLSGEVNQFITFHVEDANWPKLIARSPRLCAAVRTSEQKRKDFEIYIKHHPSLDGNFADTAVRMGCSRHTFLHYQTDTQLMDHNLAIDLSPHCLQKFSLVPESYITVHDGWDAEYRLVAKRPTKAYPSGLWVEVVRRVKLDFPDLAIVQLGGKTGQSIPNVDVDLRNKTTLAEAAAIIQAARTHVDTESGLVHLARCLGTTSVVLFGPTNAEYFAYQENRNIVPSNCGNCWWATEAWMDACPRGLSSPVCLDSIAPARVAAEVAHVLRPRTGLSANLEAALL